MVGEGDVVGEKYLIERRLGAGGMGTVYQAVHEEIGKRVAIKLLNKRHAWNKTAVARFRGEALAAAAAGHPGIIDIFDLGVTSDGSLFLVMELLEGCSLRTMLERQQALDVPTTAYICCQVLSALSAAHAAGIIHRDLKPDNIFLVDTRATLFDVKLLDFGVSRVTSTSEDGSVGGASFRTETGAIVGTPHYMSPEQLEGKRDLDGRSDIFAMGVILYECLTGRMPFRGDNYNAVIVSVAMDTPLPPSELVRDLPDPIETLILRAMEKDRAERHESAEEMFDDLLPCLGARMRDRVIPPVNRGPISVESEEESASTTQGDHRPRRVHRRVLWSGLVGLATVAVALGTLLALMALQQNGAAAQVEGERPPRDTELLAPIRSKVDAALDASSRQEQSPSKNDGDNHRPSELDASVDASDAAPDATLSDEHPSDSSRKNINKRPVRPRQPPRKRPEADYVD